MEQRDETGSVFRIIKMRPDGQMTSSAPPGPPGESYDEAIARIVRAAPPLSDHQRATLQRLFKVHSATPRPPDPDARRIQIEDRETVTVSGLYIGRPVDGGYDVLRQFSADVEHLGEDDAEPHAIGMVTGWIGWRVWNENIWKAADAISSAAEPLGAVADEVRAELAEDGIGIAAVLLMDRMTLKPQWRGNRLTRRIVADLVALLRLPEDATLVLTMPEPQRTTGGPYPDGPERNEAQARLCAAVEKAGFSQWKDSAVWWFLVGGKASASDM